MASSHLDNGPLLFFRALVMLVLIYVPLGDSKYIYAFLERKAESTYQELFEAISDRCGAFGADLEPSTVIGDFELAMKVAVIQAETGRPPIPSAFAVRLYNCRPD